MLGNPDSWKAFHQAKDAPINSLCEAKLTYQAPSCIADTVHELEAIQIDLSDVQSYLAENRHLTTANQSTPLYTLPFELLSEIISLAVCRAGNHPEIFRLLHVSRRLRDTMFDMSWLFTEADWDSWSSPLLEWWCRHARGRPLKIYLSDHTIRSFSLSTTSPKEALLQSCSSQWGTMIILFWQDGVENSVIATGIKNLLTCSAPSLHKLQVSDLRVFQVSPEDPLVLDCAPAFRLLHMGRVWIQLPASHTSVTDLSCVCERPGQWARCLTIVQSCQSLQKLNLDLSVYENVVNVNVISIDDMDPIITSLVHLELKGIRGADVSSICQFLGHLGAPALESLSIGLCDLDLVAHANLYGSLALKFPGIRSFSVCGGINIRHAVYVEAMLHPIFNSLTREPIFFPHLMQLHMSFDGAGTLSDPVLAQAIQDLVALRGKRITHLTTPAYQDVKVMQFLRDQVPYIKVLPTPGQ